VALVAALGFGCARTAAAQNHSGQEHKEPSVRVLVAAGGSRLSRHPSFGVRAHDLVVLYGGHSWQPLWTQNGAPTAAAQTAMKMLAAAADEGLDPAKYDGPVWSKAAAEWPDHANAADVTLSLDTLRYIHDLCMGRTGPAKLPKNVKPTLADLAAQLSQSADAGAWERLDPPYPQYGRLKQALVQYRGLLEEKPPALTDLPHAIKPGGHYRGLAALGTRLQREGDFAPGQTPPTHSTLYQGAIVDAVRRYQARHGLPDNGVLGAETVAALEVPARVRVEEIKLTLERWRLTPRNAPPPVVIVNIPAFRLRAFDQWPASVFDMAVVAGEAYKHETPPLETTIASITFRPDWTVPLTIARHDLLPKLARDPGLFQRQQFELIDDRGQVASGPLTAARRERIARGALTLRQQPGPENALGLIRFNLTDEKEIYLHGTPQDKLFDRTRRDLSHGCLRVEVPQLLATWLLRRQGWNAQGVATAVNAQQSSLVQLAQPVPILLTYDTVSVTPAGEVMFFPDVYRKNAALAARLFN
jgi:murein L,D-transpeptidase YcbB/YkuD